MRSYQTTHLDTLLAGPSPDVPFSPLVILESENLGIVQG